MLNILTGALALLPNVAQGAPMDLPQAEQVAVAALATSHGFPDEVLTDRPGDGSLWAYGSNWKMRFDGDGAAYFPFLGSDAPRNFPVRFKLAGASIGGQPLALQKAGQAQLSGDRVSIDHGPLVESYRLEPGAVEQLFWLEERVGHGDLLVELDVTTELDRAQSSASLTFRNELGSVSYSSAIAVDAQGHQSALETRLTDRGLSIRVPASVVEHAAWPLTIDPVLTTVAVADDAFDAENPDVAWDEGNGFFAVVWERPFSASDSDVLAMFVNGATGNVVPNSARIVDSTTVDWKNPSVGNAGATEDFLFVAERGATDATAIWGRIRPADLGLSGPQFEISNLSGYHLHPVVGGDPGPSPASGRFLVVWERVRFVGSADRDIWARLIRADGTLLGQQLPINSTINTDDRNPAISKSRGAFDWTIVWQRNLSANNSDVLGAQVNSSGSVSAATFTIDGFQTDTEFPVVSSPLADGSWLVAYRAFIFGRWEIFCRLYEAGSTSPIDALTITTNDGSPATSKSRPFLDASDSHFMVTYSEFENASIAPIFATTLFVDLEPTRDLEIEEGYFLLGGDNLVSSPAPVASTGVNSSDGQRFLSVWDQFNPFGTDNDVYGALVRPRGPANDNCINAQTIAGTGIFSFENGGANTDGEPHACGASGQVWADVWYRWTAPGAGTYSVSTCGGTVLDTAIAVYPGSSCPDSAPNVCNDDACGLQSQAVFGASAGQTFYFRLGSKDLGEEGSGTFQVHLVTDGALGETFCVSAPNSVSPGGAQIAATGSTNVGANDLVLRASALPSGVPGLFFFGPNAIQVPFGNGIRCIGGATRRLYPFQHSNASGNVAYALDNTVFPVSELTAGLTVLFQFWHRDLAGGGAGFNLTNGLALTFIP